MNKSNVSPRAGLSIHILGGGMFSYRRSSWLQLFGTTWAGSWQPSPRLSLADGNKNNTCKEQKQIAGMRLLPSSKISFLLNKAGFVTDCKLTCTIQLQSRHSGYPLFSLLSSTSVCTPGSGWIGTHRAAKSSAWSLALLRTTVGFRML